MNEAWTKLDGRVLKTGHSLTLHQYQNGLPAVEVLCDTGEPQCRLTVNLDDPLGELEFHARFEDRKFSPEIFDALVAEGIAKPTGKIVAAGYVERYAEVWELVNDSAEPA